MAFDVSAMKATKAAVPARQGSRTTRDLGPNPWLDPSWPFNLQASYDQNTAFDVPVKGTIELKPATRGKPKERGESVEKLTGDAYNAVALIRDAADKLDLGAAIRTYVDKTPEGKAIPKGVVIVRYAGQKRKAAPKPKVVTPVTPENAGVTPQQ